MDQGCGCPYFDPEFDFLSEKIAPLEVCFDNETCDDCTLVKVDSANRHGILLEMVQALADADLIISKSYISSDGGWLMDVFHVTDHNGRKITNYDLKQYISHSLAAHKHPTSPVLAPVTTSLGNLLRTENLPSNSSAVEIVATDLPSLFHTITTALFQLSFDIEYCKLWTHSGRSACILHITDQASTHGLVPDPTRLCLVEQKVGNVLNDHHLPGESWRARVIGPTDNPVHAERRLHQLLNEDKDYEGDEACNSLLGLSPQAWIESWKERDYSVVNVKCKDRPKLHFDTVCALTDLDYDVFHASFSCYESFAVQEYYVRRMDGCTVDNQTERQLLVRCLVATVERRISNGKKIELRTTFRDGLLSDTSRVFRERGLRVDKIEFARQGELAGGEFYVKDIAGGIVDAPRVEEVLKEIKGNEKSSKLCLKSDMWSHVDRFSSNMSSIQS